MLSQKFLHTLKHTYICHYNIRRYIMNDMPLYTHYKCLQSPLTNKNDEQCPLERNGYNLVNQYNSACYIYYKLCNFMNKELTYSIS